MRKINKDLRMRSNTKLAKNSISIFLAQVFLYVSSALATVLLARTLGPSGKGIFALVTLVPWLLVEFGNFGIGTAVVYFIGKRKYKLEEIVNTVGLFALLWGGMLAVLVLLFSGYLFPLFLKGVAPLLAVMTIAIVPFWLLYAYFNFVLLAKDRIKQFNLLNMMRPTVFILLFALILILPVEDKLLGAVSAWVVAEVVCGLLSVRWVKKPTFSRPSFNFLSIKEMLGYGLKAHLGNVLLYFNYRLDLLLVGMFLNVTQVGFYSIALAMSEAIWRIPNSIGLALFPKISLSSTEEGNAITPVVTRNTIFLTSLACLPFLMFGREIVSLTLGPKFIPSLPALWLLLPGVVIFSASKILVNYFNGSGKPLVSGLGGIVSLTTMIVLDILFIPRWGISGAALASTISYTVFSVIMLLFFMIGTRVPLREVLVVKLGDCKSYLNLGRKILNGSWLSRVPSE